MAGIGLDEAAERTLAVDGGYFDFSKHGGAAGLWFVTLRLHPNTSLSNANGYDFAETFERAWADAERKAADYNPLAQAEALEARARELRAQVAQQAEAA